jgi:hypothetical protein
MLRAAWYVKNHPGCAILPVSEYLGFTLNRGFGYDPVHRAIAAGLIVAKRGTGNAYALFPPAAGEPGDAVLKRRLPICWGVAPASSAWE